MSVFLLTIPLTDNVVHFLESIPLSSVTSSLEISCLQKDTVMGRATVTIYTCVFAKCISSVKTCFTSAVLFAGH